jgi:hypothetical protein
MDDELSNDVMALQIAEKVSNYPLFYKLTPDINKQKSFEEHPLHEWTAVEVNNVVLKWGVNNNVQMKQCNDLEGVMLEEATEKSALFMLNFFFSDTIDPIKRSDLLAYLKKFSKPEPPFMPLSTVISNTLQSMSIQNIPLQNICLLPVKLPKLMYMPKMYFPQR